MSAYLAHNAMWLPPTIIDQTKIAPTTLRKGTRAGHKIFAAILHQTASNKLNVPMNYKNTNSHFVIMPNGGIVQNHPIEALLWASSGFNPGGIAIEFVGNFRNDRGTWWKGDKYGRHSPTEQQIDAGHSLLRYFKESFGIAKVFSHRQGYVEYPRTTPAGEPVINQRGNCPGPEIWYYVGEWAVKHLGYSDGGPGYKVYDGSPIPATWRKPQP